MTAQEKNSTGQHIVIAGASFAGLGAAYTLRQRLPKHDRITVIAPSDPFVFAPSLVSAALGQTSLHSTFALEPALRAKNIAFLRSSVREVRIAERTIRTDDSEQW
jgi:sulfide:quinone oxidoreductase